MIKIGMASLGCPKNQVDAEIMLAKLKDKGYEITPYEQEAQVIIGKHLRVYRIGKAGKHRHNS